MRRHLYHAHVSERLDVDRIDRGNGYCATTDCQPRINRYEAGTLDGHCVDNDCRPDVYDLGTLTVDVMDVRTNRLVWRGWAERGFDRVIDDQRAMERTVDDVVARILARWPPTPL